MKKLLLLLSIFPGCLNAQIIEKIPKTTASTFGMVIVKPADFSPAQSYPLVVWLCGIASRGPGTLSSLDLLANGEIPVHLQRAAEKYKFIVVAPQTADDYDTEIDYAYTYSYNNFKIDTERNGLFGFSLGGGATVRYSFQSLANANKFSCIVPIAMTGQTGTWKNITDAKLASWFFHNSQDDVCPSAATNTAVSAINGLSPAVPAVKTIFNATGHGGTEALNPDVLPVAYNGQGLTNPAGNVYDWFLTCTKTNPIAPPGQMAPSGLVAVGTYTINGNVVTLDGRGSFNYKSAKWAAIAVPGGVNIWGVNVIGGGTEYGTVPLPAPGNYTFRLWVYPLTGYAGAGTYTDVTVTYSGDGTTDPPPPAPTPTKTIIARLFVAGMEVIVYSDKTAEVK